MPIKLAILHYNILEKYPPAMNFIRDLEGLEKGFNLTIVSTKNTTTYTHFDTSIGSVIRLGSIVKAALRVIFLILFLI